MKYDLEREIIEHAKDVIVWITGDPEDSVTVTSIDKAMEVLYDLYKKAQERSTQYWELSEAADRAIRILVAGDKGKK